MSVFIKTEDVFCSLVSPYNLYMKTGMFTKSLQGKDVMTVKHLKDGKEFYCIELNNPGERTSVEHWKHIVLNPVCKAFEWPVDVVGDNENMFLVFPYEVRPKLQSISRLSRDHGYLGLENQSIKKVALNLIDAFSDFYGKYSLYLSFDDDLILVNTSNGDVWLPFTEYVEFDDRKVYVTAGKYFSEVSDPYAYLTREIDGADTSCDVLCYDNNSDMYAFASILFRLLTGIYPYEGYLMTGVENKFDTSENARWITKYLTSTVFVFAPDDDRNSIDSFNEFKSNVARWNAMSEELKQMFIDVFSGSNVLRKNGEIKYYTPQEWKIALQRSGLI